MNNEFDDFFQETPKVEQEPIEVLEVEEKPPKKKFSLNLDLKNDKVLFIQIILITIWLLLTVLVYFFGYNLFSPFIEV